MKKLFAFCIVILFLISGCTFNVEVLTPGPFEPTPSATQEIILTPVATISATAVPLSPTPVPTTTYPVFFNARTASSHDDFDKRTSFPAGTKEVYAIWDYQNMRQGLLVRREWYWNNQLWLTREEAWDFGKYGANGTIRDVSIYDNVTGLNSGAYQLRLYIDNVLQPIGPEISSPVNPWVTFNIGSDEFTAGYGSWDSQWGVEVYGEKRIILKNVVTGISTQIYTAREVPYVTWFNDSKHFLFVERDRSGQKPGTTIGIRDDLWLVDVPSGAMRLLHKSDTNFNGSWGPVVSPDGRYIASLEGSRFGDACLMDSRLIFFELGSDFNSVKVIKQQEFSGLPAANDGFIYPAEDGYWQDGNVYLVTLDGTCNADKSKLGQYTFNMANRVAAPVSSSTTPPPIAGDLGWGSIHGKVVDAATGAPIRGATVTCAHGSYTSPAPCVGSVATNDQGIYTFENIFFHDTDTVNLTVEATGYQPKEFGQTFFTFNGMETDFALSRLP